MWVMPMLASDMVLMSLVTIWWQCPKQPTWPPRHGGA